MPGLGHVTPTGRSLLGVAGVAARVKRMFRWLATPPAQHVPRWWLHCPICDRDLVGPFPAGALVTGPAGPLTMEPTREELIAKCPVHGHRPYNDPQRGPGFRQVSE